MPLNSVPRSGVYVIVNKVNGKVYVGSAIRLARRIGEHRKTLSKGSHRNRHLQASWNKYGAKSFAFRILERCWPAHCVEREQWWMDELNACSKGRGYNKAPTAGSMLGFIHSQESRGKIAAKARGRIVGEETRKMYKQERVARWADPAYKARLSQVHKQRYTDPTEHAKLKAMVAKRWADPRQRANQARRIKGQVRTAEQRARMSAAAYKRWAKGKATATRVAPVARSSSGACRAGMSYRGESHEN